jgi:hypothetical protein
LDRGRVQGADYRVSFLACPGSAVRLLYVPRVLRFLIWMRRKKKKRPWKIGITRDTYSCERIFYIYLAQYGFGVIEAINEAISVMDAINVKAVKFNT